MFIQQKTGRPVQFESTTDARASLLARLDRRGGTVDDYAFPSQVDHSGHLSTRQYAQLVDERVTAVGFGKKNTSLTRFGAPKRPSSIRRPVISARLRSCCHTKI
jgi:hypothetical protein